MYPQTASPDTDSTNVHSFPSTRRTSDAVRTSQGARSAARTGPLRKKAAANGRPRNGRVCRAMAGASSGLRAARVLVHQLARLGGELLVLLAEGFQLALLELFEVHQRVVALGDADQLVELDLQRRRVAVLRVLDQEHHQESYDGRAGVDDELPGVAVAEDRARHQPGDDREGGEHERARAAR